ncbi:MAG: hypothetical protein ACLSU6_02530 [Thomasclavelia ramosa]
MNVQKISEKEIVIALLDAGMDTEKINEFIESINSEYFQKSKNILLSQRAELLLKILRWSREIILFRLFN